jgi:hypothetical protein
MARGCFTRGGVLALACDVERGTSAASSESCGLGGGLAAADDLDASDWVRGLLIDRACLLRGGIGDAGPSARLVLCIDEPAEAF